MKAIIPIGGGEIANKTTKKIDEYIISLANKDKARVLFIPIASGDSKPYIDKFIEYYSSLNCIVDVLYLSKEQDDLTIQEKIFSSDIIYIGGTK